MRLILFLFLSSLIVSCGGEPEKEAENSEIELPKIEFQNYNEKISYCIGMDHGKVSSGVYNGPKTKGKFNNEEITAGMVDYLTDQNLRIDLKRVDSILNLYLKPGGEVDETSVSKKDASYAIGLTEAQYLVGSLVGRGIDQKIDPWFLAQGVRSGMTEDESTISYIEAQKEVKDYYNELTLENGQNFLENNAKRDSVTVTESGLQYQIMEEGTGKKPNLTDSCTVHYTGYFIDGRVFESTIPSNRPATFVLVGLIQGWREGLQLMKEGAKYRFYIPHSLAYGEKGNGSVPPYSALVFDIELIEVKRYQEPS